MSTTKIIKGYIRPVTVGRLIANPYGPESPLWEDDIYGNATPATLYIGTGRLWTEEEVMAILGDVGLIASGSYRPKWLVDLSAKHGLTL